MNDSRRGFSHHSLGIAGISHNFLARGHNKSREIMRSLGLFAAFIGLVGIAGGCKRASSPSKQPAADMKLFEMAWYAFDDGDYKKAQEAFEELVARFPATPNAAKASVILRLCKAHRAVDDHDWQAAQEHEKAARDQLNVVRAGATANSDLYTWTEDFKDVIDNFKDYRIAAWEFRDKINRAQDLLDEGKFEEALAEMQKFDRPGVLVVDAFRKELAVFKGQVQLARFRFDCSSLISKGDGLVNDGKLNEAKKAYLEAKALLESKEGLVLPKQERDKLLKALAAKLKSVETRGRNEEAIKAYEEGIPFDPGRAPWISARQELCSRELQYRGHLEAGDTAQKNKDWKGALDEYSKAQGINNTQEIKDRISVTSYHQLMALGKAALIDADPKSAKEYFERAKAIMDTEEVRKLIAKADSLIEASRSLK